MLCLLFQLGNERYALDARQAVEVIPLVAVKRIPQAPRGVAGIFNYRGRPVPAVDLSELATERPARELLSTRIIVVNVPDAAGRPQLTGLIAEQATSTFRCDENRFVDAGVTGHRSPYLGPVMMDPGGLVQLLRPEHLVNDSVRQQLSGANLEYQP